MLRFTLRTMPSNANDFAMRHLHQGALLKFDIRHGTYSNLEIVPEDSNNDDGYSHYPYSIRFKLHTDMRTSVTTIEPIVNKRFVQDFGIVGRDSLVHVLRQKLFILMSKS